MGGVQYSTFFLVEQLIKEQSTDTRIILPGEGQFSILCQDKNIPYSTYNQTTYVSTSASLFNDRIRIPNPFSWVFNIYAILINSIKIKKKLKQQTPHLVVTKGLLTHFSAGLACRSLNLPVIWHVQDLISPRYYGLLNSIFNYMAEKIPDHIICDGQIIKDSFSDLVYKKSDIVLNGIKTDDLERCLKSRDEVRRQLAIPANAYVIGNLGRFTPWKGQEILLKAFIEYAEKNQNSYMLLVGSPLFDNDKYFQHLMQLIDEYGLGKRVIMPGYRSDLKEVFSAMDLFIYPSLEKDTSPLALLSAISAGLPVIVSDIKCLEEVIELCSAVDVFDLRNREGLLSLMAKYEDKDIRDENGNKNRDAGRNNFDISFHTKNILECFNTVLSSYNY